MLRALHQAGAGILLGTDAAQAYHISGFSIHEELALLVEAGLSSYEAIEAGTRNAAEAMGRSNEFGTIEEGKRADLILLDANPLDNVGNIQERVGVMLRGRWLAEDQLQAMLAGLAGSYEPGLRNRLCPLTLIGLAIYLRFTKRSFISHNYSSFAMT
jgi:adenine deaminase